MARIVFIAPDGAERVVEAQVGRSIMRSAVAAGVPGIIGECGGCAACGTCHAHVDPAWIERLKPASGDEAAMLDGLDSGPGGRLTCQVIMTEALDGIVLRPPGA